MTTAVGEHPVVLITGAARRIGATIARALHAAGYDLALHCRDSRAELDALIVELEALRPLSTLALQADLADVERLPELVTATLARFGRLDGLVNNASAFHATPLGTITPAQWDELFAANARAPLFLAQAAAPHLAARRGAIVNLVDVYAERPLTGHSVYCMAKAALVMATRALAVELGPRVRVNAIAPGNILWSTNAIKAETQAIVEQRTTLGRQGSPQEIATAVLFLLRDGSYCSGAILPVDGGRLLYI